MFVSIYVSLYWNSDVTAAEPLLAKTVSSPRGLSNTRWNLSSLIEVKNDMISSWQSNGEA